MKITEILKRFRKKREIKDLTLAHVLNVAQRRAVPSLSQWMRLPKILSKKEKTATSIATTAILISFIVICGRFITTHLVDIPAVGGEYTEGLIGEPRFINPLYAQTSDVDSDITRLVFSGLFRFDPNSGLVPDLASEFSISEDHKIYTIKLREDARWHDGNPVLSRDVLFTIESMQNPDFKSPLEVSLRGVRTEQVDESTVKFILDEPFAPFLSVLTVGILPSHIWEEVSPRHAALSDLNLKPIGSGPYKFEKFVKDKGGSIRSYSLERYVKFYGGEPKIEKLMFKFYSDAQAAVEALANRQVEGVSFVSADLVSEVEKNRSVKILRPSIPQATIAFFNQSRNSNLKDANIRRALAMATDKTELINSAINGFGTAIDSPILPDMIGYSADIKKISYNADGAKQLLDAAGWKLNEETGIREKTENKEKVALSIELTSVDQPDMLRVSETLKEQWKKVGVDVIIRPVAPSNLQNDALRDRNYEIFITGEILGIDSDPFSFWHSSQAVFPGLNLAMYQNRKADTLIEEARQTTDPAARAKKYIEFQNIIAEDLPAIFLYQPTYSYAIASKIQNVVLNRIVVPADRFSKIVDWNIKTKKRLKF